MATMRDVAQRANVSIATVSFVVNGTKSVAPDTHARVVGAMKELGFRRNVVARALASRRTRIIALVFPALDHRLNSTALSFIRSAANAASAHGYNLVLWPISNDADHITNLVAGGLAEGVLLMEVHLDDERVDRLTQSGIPFVLIGRTRHPEGLTFVDVDFEQTVTDGIDYLTTLGHSNIALIIKRIDGPRMAGYGPVVRTENSYRECLLERNADPIIVTCEESPAGGRVAAAELLARAPQTTAILIMNDDAAFGVVNGLASTGLCIPSDVSILSIATSSEMGAISDPTLSTMNAPGEELGRLGAEALIDQLEGGQVGPTHTMLACSLQIGDSTAAARAT